jgi:hypothetical protein
MSSTKVANFRYLLPDLMFMLFLYLYIAGQVLAEVLSALKSSGTSNAAVYSSDPRVSREKHYGLMERHLLDGSGNATAGCDALCRSRAVILEGIFVVSLLFIFFDKFCIF